jgi:hypothetical protein
VHAIECDRRRIADGPEALTVVPLGQRFDAFVDGPRPAEVEGQQVRGIGTQVALDHANEAVDHQTGASQQYKGQRDLTGHENEPCPLPAGAEGESQGHLRPPRRRAGQEQSGHVGARDEEHEADGALQDHER